MNHRKLLEIGKMQIHLKIAEKVYDTFLSKKIFTDEPIDYLNLLIKQVRKEIKGTNLKPLYNYIDFHEGFHKPINKNGVSIDVSLIPSYKNKGEFLLWLAIFIEKTTTGGREHLPPIVKHIPAEFTILSNPEELFGLEDKMKEQEQIKIKHNQFVEEFREYFSSSDFEKND